MAGEVPFADAVSAGLPAHLRRSAEDAYRHPVRKDPSDEVIAAATGRGRRQRLTGADGVVITLDHRNGKVIHVAAPRGA